jgi:hypothetical protein
VAHPGGGVYGQLGGEVGAKASVSGAATLGVGGKLELRFETAEDAKKGAGILLKQAAVAGMEGAAGPLGMLAGAAVQPSQADMKFLSDHASAVDLRGNAAAQVSAALGFKSVAGVAGFAKAKGEDTVRLEFKKPPHVVIRQELSAQLNASAGLKLGTPNTTGAIRKQAQGGEANLLATATVEQRYTLPTNIDLSQLKHDPVGTLKSAASGIAKSEQDTVSLKLDASGGALGKRGGMLATASYSANVDQLAQSGAIGKLLHGDMKGALDAAAKTSNITLAVTPYEQVGVKYAPAGSVMGFGVGASFDAMRKDVRRPPLYEYSGGDPAASQRAIDQLGRMFEAPRT